MDNYTQYNPQPYNSYKLQQKPKPVYSPVDRIFAYAAFILGFLFVRVVIEYEPFGFLASATCIGITLFNKNYCRKKGLVASKEISAIFYLALVLSLSLVISDNTFIKRIDFWFIVISNLYAVYASYKSNNNSIILNLFKSVFESPFYEYGSIFYSIAQKSDKKNNSSDAPKKSNNIKFSLIGIFLSIPVCIIVTVLLICSDNNFELMWSGLFNYLISFSDMIIVKCFHLADNIIIFIFSIPVSMYIFSAVFSRAYKKDYENCLTKLPKTSKRILPAVMCNAFLVPLMIIYSLYVFTQVYSLFTALGAIDGIFSYSEFARIGFFELCFNALINLSIIACIMFFVKLDNKSLPKSVKGCIVIFSIYTLFLIVTAIAKMTLYIYMCGMTPLRVNTFIFMIYLFAMFIVLIVKQIKPFISFTKAAYLGAVSVLIIISLLPVDALIANYNISRYNSGEIEWMGTEAIEQLDASASIVFENYNKTAEKEYYRVNQELYDINIYNFNLTRLIARITSDK